MTAFVLSSGGAPPRLGGPSSVIGDDVGPNDVVSGSLLRAGRGMRELAWGLEPSALTGRGDGQGVR